MKITIVSNKNGLMTKEFDKKLEKTSVSQLAEGKYKVLEIQSLEQIGIIKSKLKNNQALILGSPIDESSKGIIYSRAKFKSDGITRTKDMFENRSGLMLFDFDLREYDDLSLEEYRDMLIECDPQLEDAEMFLTYGSSAGISSKKTSTGWGSIHAYCRINKEMYIRGYGEAIFNNGLNLGFGEIKVNERIFRGYINGIIDLAVLKGDASRIIYEAAPNLHKKLTREVRKDLYVPGDIIDGGIVKKTAINTMFQSKINDIVHNLKRKYKSVSKDSKEVTKRNIERVNQIYGSEKLILNDGASVLAQEVLVGNYIETSMRDPFEPEKGMNKAKIFESLDLTKRPAMHSFIHGGQMYYFYCDLESIPYVYEKLGFDDTISIIKRDFKTHMLDKAKVKLADLSEKSKSVINKRIKEADFSHDKDIACSSEGFEVAEETDTEIMKALKQLDNTFYILEGKHPLYAEVDDNGTVHYYTSLKLRETYKDFNTKKSDFITEWVEGGHRKKIKGVRFDPSKAPGEIMNNGYFNLWKGFSCEAREGNIDPFINFTKDIVCGGDDKLYEFLMDYLAHIVQNPNRKEGMACVLKGKKGVGKDTWIGAFASLFDRSHYGTVNNMNAITGRFNAHLQNTIICNVGEAFFSGDHAAEGALKTLITEHDMHYEQKGIDSFLGHNFTRVFMSTNLDWVVPASGNDERRYIVLDVSDKYRGNLEYMDKFRLWQSSGGREALLHFLIEREITHSMYKAPETQGLMDQKEQSLKAVEKWIYDCAMTDTVLGSIFETRFFNTEAKISDMFEAYKVYSKDKYTSTISSFGRKINTLAAPETIRKHVGIVKIFKKSNFIESFKEKTGILIFKADLGSFN